MTVVLIIVVKEIIIKGRGIYFTFYIFWSIEYIPENTSHFHYGVENPTTSLEHFEGNSK